MRAGYSVRKDALLCDAWLATNTGFVGMKQFVSFALVAVCVGQFFGSSMLQLDDKHCIARTRCRNVPKDGGQVLQFNVLLDEAQEGAHLGEQHASLKKFKLEKRKLKMKAEEFG